METRGKRFLFSCLGGCGLIALLCVGGCIGFMVWLRQPGELLEPEALLGTDTTGYVEWTLRLEDPGTRSFADKLLQWSRTRNGSFESPLPDWLDTMIASNNQRQNEAQLDQLFPVVAAWTVRPATAEGAETRDEHLLTVSLEKLGNRLVMMDWFLGFLFSQNGRQSEYLGEKIYNIGAGDTPRAVFFLRGNDLFFVSDVETAHLALERLRLPLEGARTGTELERLYAMESVGETPLRGALVNANGELFRIFENLAGEDWDGDPRDEVWSRIDAVTLGGGFAGDTAFALTFDLWTDDAGWAAENGPGLLAVLGDELRNIDPDLELETSARGKTIHAEVRIPELGSFLENLFGIRVDVDGTGG